MNDWSKWLDYWLQKLKPNIPTYVKDSQSVLNDLKKIKLPPNAKLFTADATAMYNNIDTEHAITVISWWLNDMNTKGQLLSNFPLEAVIHAMKVLVLTRMVTCYVLMKSQMIILKPGLQK